MGRHGDASAGGGDGGGSAFERVSHRRHFDIVGRKLKGSSTNLAHARSEANEKRKRTLLQEYRKHGKAGGVIDRRFGEGDASVDADEKALWRMQRLRQMQFGRASRFALADEGDEDMLTHLGSSLAELDGADDFVPSDGEDDELNDLITREYHFGGGLFTKKAAADDAGKDAVDGDEDGAELRRKSKREVMAEIIAKSKTAKRERAKEKEEDDEQLDALDLTFKALANAGALRNSLRTSAGHLKSSKPVDRRRRGMMSDPDGADVDDFDALANELANDARASRVADRLKTADEVAAQTAAQLAELERKRQKRMRQRGSDGDDTDDDDDVEAPKGGYAAKRLKRVKRDTEPAPSKAARAATGDDLGENFVVDGGDAEADEADASDSAESSSHDGSGSDAEDADEDDLRRSFKDRVGSIKGRGDLHRGLRRLRRLGILKDGVEAGESSEESSEEGSEEDEEEEDEEGSEGGSEKGSEEEDEEADGATRAHVSEPSTRTGKTQPAGRASAVARINAAAVREPHPRAAQQPDDGAVGGSAELPFTFEAPSSHAQFLRYVTNRSPEDLSCVVQRICACHAISLAPDNRRKLQVFFGILLVHFDFLAQQAPLPQAHVDALVPHILVLSREVPFYAATAARARLERMQKAASESLARGGARWPPARSIMLLRLFMLMFPTSDFRHPVLTPVAVLLGQYLAHSEVRSARDAAVGVIVATLAVRLASASKRFVPEAVAFLAGLVHASAEESAASLAGLPAHQAHQQGGSWLHLPTARASARGSTAAPETLSISRVLGTAANDPYFDSRELRAAALHTALQTLASAADSVALLPAGEALLAPARDAVDRLTRGPCGSRLAPATLAVAAAVVAAHGRAASAVHQPLQLHKRKREAIKTFNPRFEEDGFVRGRDYDIDRQRSEARNLKKQIAREAKGAARELRKDNRFLAEERARVQEAESAEREGKYRAAMSFLEQQEANFKSGGQGGAVKKRRPSS